MRNRRRSVRDEWRSTAGGGRGAAAQAAAALVRGWRHCGTCLVAMATA